MRGSWTKSWGATADQARQWKSENFKFINICLSKWLSRGKRSPVNDGGWTLALNVKLN